MNANGCRPEHLDERAADPGEQRITRREGHDPPPRNVVEQRWQTVS
jgi:hypothetical protein